MRLGVDICSIPRLRRALDRSPQLLEELFSADEITYCSGLPRPEMHLAARWAAKEACLKAFGLGILGYDLNRLEVVHEGAGETRLRVHCPRLRADMRRHHGGVDPRLVVALSHDGDYAVACVAAP